MSPIHGHLSLPAFTHTAMYGIGWADTSVDLTDVVAIHGLTTTGGITYLKLGVAVDTPLIFTTDDRFRVAGVCAASTASGNTFLYTKAGKATIDMGAGNNAIPGAGIFLDTTTGKCDSTVGSATAGDNMRVFSFSMEYIATDVTGDVFVLPWRG